MPTFTHRLICTSALSCAVMALLSSCATPSAPDTSDRVQQITSEHLGRAIRLAPSADDTKPTESAVHALLAQPLDADSAVQIALLNNPSLQARLADLGIARADLLQANHLPNPGLVFKHTQGGNDVTIERSFTMDLIALITAPQRHDIEQRHLAQSQLNVAAAALALAHDTRNAYFTAIAAKQSAGYAQQVAQAAEVGATLASKLQQAGNWNALEATREQVFAAETAADLTRATMGTIAAREHLARLLGIEDAQAIQLPDHLPDLPTQAAAIGEVETYAMQNRLDVAQGKQEVAAMASSLGLNKATRFINVLDLGAEHDSQRGVAAAGGYIITVEVPLFDWGESRVARAEANYMQAIQQLTATAHDARSQVREQYATYQHAYELAKQYRDTIVPMRKRISDENQLRYNAMLISVFDLLADAREQAASVNAYLNAQKDFWLADSDLQAALGGKLPATPTITKAP